MTKTLFSLIFLLFWTLTQAQWQPTNGPYNGKINVLAINGNNIYAGANGNILFSSNFGTEWANIGNNLPRPINIRAILIDGSNIFIGSDFGAFISSNNGSSWTKINTGLTDTSVYCISKIGSLIFAGTNSGIYATSNNGSNWAPSNIGIPNTRINAIKSIGSNIFAATWAGVFLSTNNGSTWAAVNSGLTSLSITSMAISGTNIFVGSSAGVFLSTNNGTSWTSVNSNLPAGNTTVNSCDVIGTSVFVGKTNNMWAGALYRSTNNGTNWTQVTTGINPPIFDYLPMSYCLASIGSTVYCGSTLGLHSSIDNGTNWNSNGLGWGGYVNTMFLNSTDLFCGTRNGIYKTVNGGNNWSSCNSGLPSNVSVYSFCKVGSTLICGTYTNGIYVSNNNGVSWTNSNTGLPSSSLCIGSLCVTGNTIIAGALYYGGVSVFTSTNNGASWTSSNSGMSNGLAIYKLLVNGPVIFAGTNSGCYISTNNGASWIASNTNLPVNHVTALTAKNGTIFAGQQVQNPFTGGVFVSMNYGSSWGANTFPNNDIWDLATDGTVVISAGNIGGGINSTNNNGATWQSFSNGLEDFNVFSFATNSLNIYAGTSGFSNGLLNGVWKNTFSSVSGIKEEISKSDLCKIFPNPSNGQFQISLDNSVTEGKLIVLNNLGEILVSQQIQSGHSFLKIDWLPKGVYHFRVLNNGLLVGSGHLMLE